VKATAKIHNRLLTIVTARQVDHTFETEQGFLRTSTVLSHTGWTSRAVVATCGLLTLKLKG
jgi:hypothetical protein